MSPTRALLLGLVLFAAPLACTCDPRSSDDAGAQSVDAGNSDGGAPVDAGRDAGVDGGAADAGRIDAGAGADAGAPDGGPLDAGADSGTPDAGNTDAGTADAGMTTTCAMLECPPWQRCVESAVGARCLGGGTITWVSPVANAVAPLDLVSIPLAIDTTLSADIDVPWSASGAIRSTGVFAGLQGLRSATLLFAESDGGVVVLTAGWDGGPTATTSFQLGPPIVRPPAPPARTNTADFEPNDPTGPAFRRDDVVAIEVDALPLPMALHARFDAPTAQTLSVPVVDRCDAGTCFRVDLRLRDVDFPAFRGRVFVWASGTDGGVQTRLRSIPVTRWRWRRQISGVPNPLSITRPVHYSSFGIAVGTEDSPGLGRFAMMSITGSLLSPGTSGFEQSTAGVTSIAAGHGIFAAFTTADGGYVDDRAGPVVLSERVVSTGTADDTRMALARDGRVVLLDPMGVVGQSSSFLTCSPSAGPFAAMAASEAQTVLFRAAGPLCVFDPYASPRTFVSTGGSYLPHFVKFAGSRPVGVLAAGLDGGLWSIVGDTTASFTEQLVFDGGVVDAVASIEFLFSGERVYWVNADRTVQRADLTSRLNNVPVGLISNVSAPSTQRIPARTVTAPVIVQSRIVSNFGALVVVDASGTVSSFDTNTLALTWSLPSGAAGVRGAVDADPIYLSACGGPRLGTLAIAARDGSLYMFIGDVESLPSITTGWQMGGATPENEHEDGTNPCISE